MKTARWVAPCMISALLATAGCQAPANTTNASGKNAAQTQPQAQGSKEGTKADGQQSKPRDLSIITQEDTGIKIRVQSKAYDRFLGMSQDGPIIPALMQNYTPQGMFYLKDKNWLLVSYYADDKRPGLLAVVDQGTGKLVKSFTLYNPDHTPYTGHAGGVAVSDKYVWISSEDKVHALKLDDVVNGQDRGKLTFDKELNVETNASFVTYADHVLWVGEFARVNYKTKDSHHMKGRSGENITAWVTGYKLDDNTGLIANSAYNSDNILSPDYILAIPEEIQGMAVLPDRIILSQSYGRNSDSTLLSYPNPLQDKPVQEVQGLGKSPVPLWYLDKKNVQDSLVTPPCTENIVPVEQNLYILYESASYDVRTSGTYPLDRMKMLDMTKWNGKS